MVYEHRVTLYWVIRDSDEQEITRVKTWCTEFLVCFSFLKLRALSHLDCFVQTLGLSKMVKTKTKGLKVPLKDWVCWVESKGPVPNNNQCDVAFWFRPWFKPLCVKYLKHRLNQQPFIWAINPQCQLARNGNAIAAEKKLGNFNFTPQTSRAQ